MSSQPTLKSAAVCAFLVLLAPPLSLGAAPKQGTADPKDRAIEAKLDEAIPLTFKDAPLVDVLKFIKSASQGPTDTGIPIYVDPAGLKRAGSTVNSRVSIESARDEPLRDSMDRMLRPLGLAFRVKGGLLQILDRKTAAKDGRP